MAATNKRKAKLPHPRPQRPPSLAKLMGEGGGIVTLPRLLIALPQLARMPRGHGAPVMLLPGFGAGDASNGVMSALLTYLGYRVSGWGLGLNRGNVEAMLPRVAERVKALAEKSGAPVRLVGWSLGGVFAREVARDAPQFVDRVITMGTPVIGGPKYTRTGFLYSALGADLDDMERRIEARNAVPLRVPVTAIYCKADGIVDWRACIDHAAPDIDHIEVRSTHLTLGIDPQVLKIVAEKLAAKR